MVVLFFNERGNILLNKYFSNVDIKIMLNILTNFPSLSYSFSTSDKIIVGDKTKYFKVFKKMYAKISSKENNLNNESVEKELNLMPIKEVNNLKSYLNNNNLEIQKLFMIGNNKNLLKFKNKLLKKLGDKVRITDSGVNNLEINSHDVSKGLALEYLANILNISLKQTMAFGDSANDIDLMETAGVSIVMSNSNLDILKEKADIIAPSHDNDGVAKILSRLY